MRSRTKKLSRISFFKIGFISHNLIKMILPLNSSQQKNLGLTAFMWDSRVFCRTGREPFWILPRYSQLLHSLANTRALSTQARGKGKGQNRASQSDRIPCKDFWPPSISQNAFSKIFNPRTLIFCFKGVKLEFLSSFRQKRYHCVYLNLMHH